MAETKKGIHLVTEGFELDRVIEPIYDYPIQKMIILRSKQTNYPEADKLSSHYVEKIKKELRVEVEVKETDIYSFEEVYQKTAKIIKQNQQKPIYINISSAPKLALVAMITAAYQNKQKNTEIFYVKPQKYLLPQLLGKIANDESLEETKKEFLEHGFAKGKTSYEQIPIFPIQQTNELDKKILKTLKKQEQANSITKLKNQIEKKSNESIKRSTLQYRIKKLEQNDLIKTQRENRRLKIEIQKLGEIYLKNK
ncbi:hypothetical protein C9439_00105 [archaeon SCG-AAA382B04]|nr:hypothetical protein C9439_00105 [archaeon SCG-AAA382B04]